MEKRRELLNTFYQSQYKTRSVIVVLAVMKKKSGQNNQDDEQKKPCEIFNLFSNKNDLIELNLTNDYNSS